MDPSKTLVATPAYDGVDVEYTRGVIDLARNGARPEWLFLPGHADIRLVRDLIAYHFLKTKLEHLVMIDADIGFTYNDWKQLDVNTPSACASFARRTRDGLPVTAGLGFCRIDRIVFEAMRAQTKRFYFENYPDPIDDFFEQGPGIVNGRDDAQWSSEAHCFWSRVARAKMKTCFVTDTQLVHYGRFGFKLEAKKSYVL